VIFSLAALEPLGRGGAARQRRPPRPLFINKSNSGIEIADTAGTTDAPDPRQRTGAAAAAKWKGDCFGGRLWGEAIAVRRAALERISNLTRPVTPASATNVKVFNHAPTAKRTNL